MKWIAKLTDTFSSMAGVIKEMIQEERQRSTPEARHLTDMKNMAIRACAFAEHITDQPLFRSTVSVRDLDHLDRPLTYLERELLVVGRLLGQFNNSGFPAQPVLDLDMMSENHWRTVTTVLDGLERDELITREAYPLLYQLVDTRGMAEIFHRDQQEARTQASDADQEWRLNP